MNCSYINKYADKLFTGSLNFIEEANLEKHMENCKECRGKYEKMIEQDRLIKQASTMEIIPHPLGADLPVMIKDEINPGKTFNVKRYLSAAVVFLVILLPLLYKYSLNNSKKPVDSKPQSYIDLNMLDEDTFTGSLKEYIKQNCGIQTSKGQVFVSIEYYGSDGNGSQGHSYLWALVEEYSMNDGDYKVEASISTPMVIELQKKDDSYYPVSLKIPDSSTNVQDSVKKIFPEKYWGKIIDQKDDMQSLKDKNLMQARDFYRIKITDFSLKLSPGLLKTYNNFAKTRDYSLLKGLQPIDIYKMYFHADEVEDYRTVYSLYYNDGKWLMPTLKDFLNDVKNDKTNKESTAKLIKMLNEDMESAYFEFIDKHEGHIVLNLKKGISDEDPARQFSLLRGDDGIWKVQWLPMQ